MSHQYRRVLMALPCKFLSLLAPVCCVLCLSAGWAKAEPQTDSTPRVPADSAPRVPAGSGRITAIFYGLRSREGYLRVSLYNRSDGFPNGSSVARRDIRLQTLGPATPSNSLTVTFEGLPSGVYAVCAFHDGDGNGKMTQNFLGIPQEEWGMSNNPRPRFRAPRFDQARLNLSAQEAKTVLITLHT